MILKTLLKAIKPFRLISLLMTYILGAGLVQYVRQMRDWGVLLQGAIFILLVVLSVDFLYLMQTLAVRSSDYEKLEKKDLRLIKWVCALLSATFLTVATTLMVNWMMNDVLSQSLLVLFILFLVAGGLYYLTRLLPKLRVYQILVEAVLFVGLPPAIAFFLQSTDAHPFLTLISVSLTPAYVAMRLLRQISQFGTDQKQGRRTIVTQVGWERAMTYHNAFILLTYLFLALMTLFGFPWFLLWPAFLSLPIGLLEIWLMERTRRGAKPFWRVMFFATACVLFVPLYLLAFNFWVR